MGRPSKELYAVVGALVLQQALDLTGVQKCEAAAFDTRRHFAPDIEGDSDKEKYVCERTLRGYSKQHLICGKFNATILPGQSPFQFDAATQDDLVKLIGD